MNDLCETISKYILHINTDISNVAKSLLSMNKVLKFKVKRIQFINSNNVNLKTHNFEYMSIFP